MANVVSPRPRPATPTPVDMAFVPSSTDFFSQDRPLNRPSPHEEVLQPPRLGSPIHLRDSGARNSFISNLSSCSPNRRRRCLQDNIYRSTRRRPHCSRSDCQFSTLGPAVFESMRWISSPNCDTVNSSRLDEERFEYSGVMESSGAGPIRTRKTPTRPSPLELDYSPSSQEQPEFQPFLPRQDFMSLSPRTPHRSVSGSEVRFRRLLPVLPGSPRYELP